MYTRNHFDADYIYMYILSLTRTSPNIARTKQLLFIILVRKILNKKKNSQLILFFFSHIYLYCYLNKRKIEGREKAWEPVSENSPEKLHSQSSLCLSHKKREESILLLPPRETLKNQIYTYTHIVIYILYMKKKCCKLYAATSTLVVLVSE